MRNLLYAATALAAVIALPVAAHADTISFGWSFAAGPIPAANIQSAPFNAANLGGGWFLSTSALAAPPLSEGSLNGTAISVKAGGTGTLFVYITDTGITGPVGPTQYSTTFDNINSPIPGFTEIGFTGSSYLSSTNNPFALTTGLTTSQFIGPGADPAPFLSATMTPGLPYSLTEVFQVNATGGLQQVSAAMDIAAVGVPEPASLALLGVGLLGLGFVANRKRSV